jgi:3-phosphoshikimate 1-carboxyvinyltransferase
MNSVTIQAPASKSLSHRALIASALAGGESRLSHVLESGDIERTRDILSSLGALLRREGDGLWRVTGLDGRVEGGKSEQGGPLPVFVSESGTTCRLILAVLAAGRGRFSIYGEGRMHERPVRELTDALVSLGAGVTFTGRPGCPPLLLESRGLDIADGCVSIGCDESSQYLSGLLLAAPLTDKGLCVHLGGRRAVSWPYVSLTLDIMERFGAAFRVQSLADGLWQDVDWRRLREAEPGRVRFLVAPGRYQAGEISVEGDWSGASYFLAAGAVGPKPVRLTGLERDSLQGDAAIMTILEDMGAAVTYDGNDILVRPSPLEGIEVDMGHCPDLVPTVAALAAHASGRTVIKGAAHLAIKESNRIEAPAAELAKCGCAVRVTDDGLIIDPPENGPVPPAPGVVLSAHNDHRIAMSLALLGLPGKRTGQGANGESGPGFTPIMDNPACVAKSFPHFWALWRTVAA